MPLNQEVIAELIPDNTTKQVSPKDVRDSFSEVARAYDGLSVSSVRAIVDEDVGDGSVAGDCNATDFSGQAEPDPAPDTFIEIADGSLVQFFHKGVAYFWAGPSGVTVGLGGNYVAVAAHFQSAGVSDHGLLVGREDDDHTQYHNDARGDTRYQGQIDTLVLRADETDTEQTTQDGRLTQNETDIATLQSDKLGVTAWLNYGFIKCLRLFADGNGAADPTVAAEYNVASVVRTAVGTYRITMVQSTFWGIQISEANSMLIPAVKLPSTANAQVQYLYFVSPGVYDLFVYELSPTGPNGSITPILYDLQAGDTMEVLGWMDAGDGTLPPAA